MQEKTRLGFADRIITTSLLLIKKRLDKKLKPYWTYHCENCLRCMGYCKKSAIEAGHSWAVILYFITSIPAIRILFQRLDNSNNFYTFIDAYWFHALLEAFYFIPSIFISYFIFWCLNQIPIMNRFFTLTTLTHYYRRFHEPKTRLKNLLPSKKIKVKKQ